MISLKAKHNNTVEEHGGYGSLLRPPSPMRGRDTVTAVRYGKRTVRYNSILLLRNVDGMSTQACGPTKHYPEFRVICFKLQLAAFLLYM